MTSVKIITDSSCDLPQNIIDDLGIGIVPLKIRFGSEEFVDRFELSTDSFWERCKISKELPSTAAPSPGAFEEMYRQAANDGRSGVVTVVLSGSLSATIEAAEAAARAVADLIDVTVIDSRTVTLGLGSLVVQAAEASLQGQTVLEISTMVSEAAKKTQVHAALDTLENLRKNGRIGAAQSFLGSVLSIKPLIEVRNGVVEPAGKQRTRSKALAHLINLIAENASHIERISIMHAACEDIDAFASQVQSLVTPKVMIGQIGPVVGAHAGLGTIGVVFQTNN